MAATGKIKIRNFFIKWLTEEREKPRIFPLSSFDRLQHEIKPCDVLLVEGRSRVSRIIKLITQSNWSHAMLYLGRIHDIADKDARDHLLTFFNCDPSEQLVIESMLGKGIIVTLLKKYQQDHIRICRPIGISHKDAQAVLNYAISKLGLLYGAREIFDLARFLFPWGIVPRRWHSSLFTHDASDTLRESCSSLIAEAFQAVDFPILPVVKHSKSNTFELVQRNPRLYTPSDFDYSPFFEIIKYPFMELVGHGNYRNLPWNRDGMLSDDKGELFIPAIDKATIADKENPSNPTPHRHLDFYD